MSIFYAQPDDTTTEGFPFSSVEEFEERAGKNVNASSQPVGEYDIEFIDGPELDQKLFDSLSVNQNTIGKFIEVADDWDETQKTKAILQNEHGSKPFALDDDPDQIDIEIYFDMTLVGLAKEFVADGYFGDVPEKLTFYIDYEALARDLEMNGYDTTSLCDRRVSYRIND
jgi:hypothetical protein